MKTTQVVIILVFISFVACPVQAAGIPYKDDAGRQIDFHALWFTFNSLLFKGGVMPH